MYASYLLYLCMRNFSKKYWQLTEFLRKLNIWPHLSEQRGGGGGKILIIVILIYRHWVIIANSEKLSDIIVLEQCEVYSTKKLI